jgi:hypothetical protein
MAVVSDPALALAETALIARAAEHVRLDSSSYCLRAEDNLIASVGPGVWERARRDLSSGKGDELAGKFRAPYSSSALAVNSFGPLLSDVSLPGPLVVTGDIAFEQQRSAWAGGYWPTLDVIVETEGAATRLFVESKCTEFLRQGHPHFSTAFVKHAQERLDVTASMTFARLAEDAGLFDPLDARQLAKHFLAAKRAVVDAAQPFKVVLLCIWWEPQDAEDYPVFARHRDAVQDFAEAVPDSDVRVIGISYPELWQHWEGSRDPVLRRHTQLLRDRYVVHIG